MKIEDCLKCKKKRRPSGNDNQFHHGFHHRRSFPHDNSFQQARDR